MISPISFSSKYQVSTKPHKGFSIRKKDVESEKKFRMFRNYCSALVQCNDNISVDYDYIAQQKYPYYFEGKITLQTPDSMDKEIEHYLEFNKIKYNKLKNPQN